MERLKFCVSNPRSCNEDAEARQNLKCDGGKKKKKKRKCSIKFEGKKNSTKEAKNSKTYLRFKREKAGPPLQENLGFFACGKKGKGAEMDF